MPTQTEPLTDRLAPHLADISGEEVGRWRDETPGCGVRAHLNNAGAGLMPLPVLDTIQGYLGREAEIGGYEAEDEARERIQAVYGHLGRLLGCAASNVAIVENATVAVSQALSAFDFQPGDVLVTTRHDYSSNQIMYLALARRRGIEVRWAPELPEGGVDPDALRRLASDPRCRLVSLTWVPTNSGLIQEAETVGEICAELGIPYLVDGCQAVGQMPVEMARLGCDFFGGTARKFLRGPRGLGFLYVSDRMLERGAYPLGLDMHGATLRGHEDFDLTPDARRFENWEFPYALVLGLGEAARYASELGIERIGQRAAENAAWVRETLRAMPGIRITDRGRRLCAIVTAEVIGHDPTAVVRRLRGRGINVHASQAEDGNGGKATPVVRISPHYYNTREELERVIQEIAEIAGRPGER